MDLPEHTPPSEGAMTPYRSRSRFHEAHALGIGLANRGTRMEDAASK